MVRRAFAFSLLGASLALLAGCHRVSDADRAAVVECIRANLAATEAGDIEAVLATIHPRSTAYAQTPKLLKELNAKFTLAYDLESAEVEKATADGIRVRFIQTTRKVAGDGDYPENRLEGVHLLKKDGEKWKIWSTQVLQVRTPDGKPISAR